MLLNGGGVCFLCVSKVLYGRVGYGSPFFSSDSPLLLNDFEWWCACLLCFSAVFDRQVVYGPFCFFSVFAGVWFTFFSFDFPLLLNEFEWWCPCLLCFSVVFDRQVVYGCSVAGVCLPLCFSMILNSEAVVSLIFLRFSMNGPLYRSRITSGVACFPLCVSLVLNGGGVCSLCFL